MVRETSGPNMKYGIMVTMPGKKPKPHWFGSDSVKRDREHNKWVEKGASVVQDIEEAK